MCEQLLIIAWQKYYDEALAQEKSPLPTTILYGSPSAGPAQQGWNTVGGKPLAKGANPWGAQNSKSYYSNPLFVLLSYGFRLRDKVHFTCASRYSDADV